MDSASIQNMGLTIIWMVAIMLGVMEFHRSHGKFDRAMIITVGSGIMATFLIYPGVIVRIVESVSNSKSHLLGEDRSYSSNASTSAPAPPSGSVSAQATASATPVPTTWTPTATVSVPIESSTRSLIWQVTLAAVVVIVCLAVIAFLIAKWRAGAVKREAEAELAVQRLKEEAERKERERQDRIAREKLWQEYLDRGDSALAEWIKYSTNMEMILKYPLIGSFTNPKVKNVIVLVNRYRQLGRVFSPNVAKVELSPLANTVDSLETAVHDIITDAKNMKRSNYSPEERKTLEKAQSLFNLAMDSGATPSERKNAYERLRNIMDELRITVTDEMEERLAIEMQPVLALTAS